MAQPKKAEQRKASGEQNSLQRAALTGGALGLYFGLFFRPVREPNLLTPLLLGVLAALVMTLLNLRRKEARSLGATARYALGAWLGFTLALLALEGRHPVYDVAGKIGVTIYTVVAGALAGLWYGYRQRDQAPGGRQT